MEQLRKIPIVLLCPQWNKVLTAKLCKTVRIQLLQQSVSSGFFWGHFIIKKQLYVCLFIEKKLFQLKKRLIWFLCFFFKNCWEQVVKSEFVEIWLELILDWSLLILYIIWKTIFYTYWKLVTFSTLQIHWQIWLIRLRQCKM